LERHVGRVDRVILTVEEPALEVDDREAGEDAANPRLLDALLDGRDELARHRAADDRVIENEARAAGKGLEVNVCDAELAVTSRLLLVLSFDVLHRGGEGLEVRNFRDRELASDAELARHLLARDLDVLLAGAVEEELARLLVAGDRKARILFR